MSHKTNLEVILEMRWVPSIPFATSKKFSLLYLSDQFIQLLVSFNYLIENTQWIGYPCRCFETFKGILNV